MINEEYNKWLILYFDMQNVLKDLRKYKGVTWSQLLEVGIDNADDLYWWYVTFSIDTTAI